MCVRRRRRTPKVVFSETLAQLVDWLNLVCEARFQQRLVGLSQLEEDQEEHSQ